MKKRILIAAAVAGCVLMVAGCALAGFDFGALFADQTEYTTVRQTENADAAHTLRIAVDTETIRLGRSADELVHITYMDSDREKHLYACEDGVISLTVDRADRKWYEYINFGFAPAERVVDVLLPAAFSGAVQASGATGAVNASGLASLSRLELTLTTGDIAVSDCEAAEARFATTTGLLHLSQLRGGAFSAECTTGAVTVDGLASSALTVRSVSGDVRIADAVCDSIAAHGTTCAIRLDRIAAKDIALRVTTGDITGSIACDPTEFTIDTATVTGSNNLGNVHFGGERSLNVQTTTGNIDIAFVE